MGATVPEGEAEGAGVKLPLKVAVTLAPGETPTTGAPGATEVPGAATGPLPVGGGGGIGAPVFTGGLTAAPGAAGTAVAAVFGPAGMGALGGGGGGAAGLF
jgi:hypothetical protein